MTQYPILAGAEPFSAEGGPHGVLVLHGFTGCPQSMRGLATAFAGAGFAVELPRLPGHGTSVEDMATTGWADWTDAAEGAYEELAARCERVVVTGLSMGGALACHVAAERPDIAGLVAINASVAKFDAALRDGLQAILDQGERMMPGVKNDVADPDQTELAYETMPIASLLSLFDGVEELHGRLGRIACPTLIMTSTEDHVVPPTASDELAELVAGPVERVTLARSFHVATLDYDRDEIERRAVEFARKVTAAEA